MIYSLKQTTKNSFTRKSISITCIFTLIFSLIAIRPNQVKAARRRKKVIKKMAEPILRVRLGQLHRSVKIEFPGGGKVLSSKRRTIRRMRNGKSFTWNLPKRRSRRVSYNNKTLIFEPNKKPLIFNGKGYRGKLYIKFTKSGATVVNHIGIENYLLGVVGKEIGSKSPPESLKAQAVIARTYAYHNKNRHGRDNADICDSTHCQVYGGMKAERSTINPAVKATRGIIMICDGKPITTLYHATCGGMTSNNEDVWNGRPEKYLRRVKCPFCTKGTKYRWKVNLSLKKLKQGLAKEKIYFKKLFDVGYESPSQLDRVAKVLLYTQKGIKNLKGTTFRRLFNLPSTTFVIGTGFDVSRKKIMPPVSPKKPAPKETKMAIITLGGCPESGPPQLVIQSFKGLKRARKPKDGWKVLAINPELLTSPVKKLQPRSVEVIKRVKNSKKGEQIKSIEVFGRGYGHQVGLCQSGAIEMGKRNWSYRQILAYYYSQVALRNLKY